MSGLATNSNLARNRIPEKSELPFLQDSALRKQKAIEQVVAKAKAAKNEMKAHKKDAARLTKELRELQGQLHPIRRCPDDILQEIFGEVVEDGRDDSFFKAVRLSHVCQRWRALAISTPSLWKRVKFTTLLPKAEMATMVHAFTTRVRNVAADVTVCLDTAFSKPADFRQEMKNLPLQLIYSIPSLSTLIIKSDYDPYRSKFLNNREVLDTMHHFPTRELERLVIKLCWSDTEPLNSFLANFPPVHNLEMFKGHFGSNDVPGLRRILSNLVTITLDHVTDLPLLSLLRVIPLLQTLDLRTCTITSPKDQLKDRCLLQHLTLIDLTDGFQGNKGAFPWARINCPVLKRVKFVHLPDLIEDEELWEFLSVTTTISDVVIAGNTHVQSLLRLAKATPQISKLKIRGVDDLMAVLAGSNRSGLQCPIFHYLLHLHITIMSGTVSADQLRELVYSRCLPRDHAQSMMNPQIEHPIESLDMVFYKNIVEIQAQAREFLGQYFEHGHDGRHSVYRFAHAIA